MLIATVTNAAAKAIAIHLVHELSAYNNHQIFLEFMTMLKEFKTLMFSMPRDMTAINVLDHRIKWKID